MQSYRRANGGAFKPYRARSRRHGSALKAFVPKRKSRKQRLAAQTGGSVAPKAGLTKRVASAPMAPQFPRPVGRGNPPRSFPTPVKDAGYRARPKRRSRFRRKMR